MKIASNLPSERPRLVQAELICRNVRYCFVAGRTTNSLLRTVKVLLQRIWRDLHLQFAGIHTLFGFFEHASVDVRR